jgi:hypothetical protein
VCVWLARQGSQSWAVLQSSSPRAMCVNGCALPVPVSQVENGGLVWRMAMPGVTYSGTIYPYDPADSSVTYEPIPYSFVVPYSWDDVLSKVPRASLSVARVFRAVRVGGPSAQASTATASPPQQPPPVSTPQPPQQPQQQQQQQRRRRR